MLRYFWAGGAVSSWLVVFFTIASVLVALPAIAQSDHEGIDCKKTQTDLELSICAGRLERQSYQEMETVYQQLAQQYQSEKMGPKDYREKQWRYLKVSQRTWLAYRQAHCRWVASKLGGGTIQPAVEASCQNGLNQKRMTELLENLED
jgi:uncharacterized protein YecT (DUF1311 family)